MNNLTAAYFRIDFRPSIGLRSFTGFDEQGFSWGEDRKGRQRYYILSFENLCVTAVHKTTTFALKFGPISKFLRL
jgi:hypothetical protein